MIDSYKLIEKVEKIYKESCKTCSFLYFILPAILCAISYASLLISIFLKCNVLTIISLIVFCIFLFITIYLNKEYFQKNFSKVIKGNDTLYYDVFKEKLKSSTTLYNINSLKKIKKLLKRRIKKIRNILNTSLKQTLSMVFIPFIFLVISKTKINLFSNCILTIIISVVFLIPIFIMLYENIVNRNLNRKKNILETIKSLIIELEETQNKKPAYYRKKRRYQKK